MKYLPFILLIIAFLIESTLFSWPLVLGVLIFLTVLYKEQWMMLVAFVSGILLDILTFHFVGSSSLFFLIVLEVVFLYQRKFEIESPFFVGISVFVFSLLYGALFSHRYAFFSAILTAVVISGVYMGFVLLQPKKKHVLL